MKYYSIEIITMKDGTSTQAIWEKANEKEAISSASSAMASAMINENVSTIYVEAKDNLGGIYFQFAKNLEE